MDAIAIAFSVVPIMAAWLGFRIHLRIRSRSKWPPCSKMAALARCRKSPVSMTQRATPRCGWRSFLRQGGYLSADDEERLVDSPRSRLVLGLMRLVCGPGGPRMVADSLRNLDLPERR